MLLNLFRRFQKFLADLYEVDTSEFSTYTSFTDYLNSRYD